MEAAGSSSNVTGVCMKAKCAVKECKGWACYDGLCAAHAMTWLLTRDSDYTPGRDGRLRRYVERQDVRAVLRKASAPFSYAPPDTRPVCGRCEQPALDFGDCASHVADEVGI